MKLGKGLVNIDGNETVRINPAEGELRTFNEIVLTEEVDKLVLEPFFNRVILKKLKVSKIGMFHVPANGKTGSPSEGIVLAVGEDCQKLVAGNRVMWGDFKSMSLVHEGEDYVIIGENDVLCRIKDNNITREDSEEDDSKKELTEEKKVC